MLLRSGTDTGPSMPEGCACQREEGGQSEDTGSPGRACAGLSSSGDTLVLDSSARGFYFL